MCGCSATARTAWPWQSSWKLTQGGYVNYCGLESSPYHALAEKYLPNGSCGVVSFGLAGGREAASTL